MVHGLIRSQTPEDREYTRYLADVEGRRGRVAELQADLAALNVTLARFNAEYQTRVGSLFVELDRVQLALDEYERRIASLQSGQVDPAHIEDDIRAEFAGRHEEVRSEEANTRQYQQAFERSRDRPELDPDAQAVIKSLYRELAKRYHPDLARTEEERRYREAVMQRVNAAFGQRDIATLQAVGQEVDVDDPAFEARSVGEKLVWAIREVARLDDLVTELDGELRGVQASDTYGLWRRQDSGEAVIEALENDLQDQLAATRDRLAELIATYRHLLDGRLQ